MPSVFLESSIFFHSAPQRDKATEGSRVNVTRCPSREVARKVDRAESHSPVPRSLLYHHSILHRPSCQSRHRREYIDENTRDIHRRNIAAAAAAARRSPSTSSRPSSVVPRHQYRG